MLFFWQIYPQVIFSYYLQFVNCWSGVRVSGFRSADVGYSNRQGGSDRCKCFRKAEATPTNHALRQLSQTDPSLEKVLYLRRFYSGVPPE